MNETGWQYLCTDYEDDGKNKLKVFYYERVKNIYGMVATVEVGRCTQIDRDHKSDIIVVREYTKNIGGFIPWREFTMADYIKCRHEEGRGLYQFGDGCSNTANPIRDSKTKNNNRRYRNDY